LIRRKHIREICSLLDQYVTSLHHNYSFRRIPLIWYLALATGGDFLFSCIFFFTFGNLPKLKWT
jgi:hypothetical protein